MGYQLGCDVDMAIWEGDVDLSSSVKSKGHKRHLVVGKFKIYFFKIDSFKKPEKSYQHLDLFEISQDTGAATKVILKYRKAGSSTKLETVLMTVPQAWPAVSMLRTACRDLHCGVPETQYVTVLLPRKPEAEPSTQYTLTVPQGLSYAYMAWRVYYGTLASTKSKGAVQGAILLPFFLEDLCAAGERTLDLSACASPDPKSPISLDANSAILSLANDNFFRTLRLAEVSCATAFEALGSMLMSNRALTKICLENLDEEQDMSVLGSSLGKCAVQVISFAGTRISNSSFLKFCTSIFANKDLSPLSLNLSNCKLNAKSMEALIDTLVGNSELASRLQYLNIEGNRLEAQASSSLVTWFNRSAGKLALKGLNIANTSADLTIIAPTIGSSLKGLEVLDISANDIDQKNFNVIVDMLGNLSLLQSFKMADTNFPPESLEGLLYSITKSKGSAGAPSLNLIIPKNGFGIAGSSAFARGSLSLKGIVSVDLQGNKMGPRGLQGLLVGLASYTSLTSLFIGNNTSDDKEAAEFVLKLIEFIKAHPTITALGMAGMDRAGRGEPLLQSTYPMLGYLAENSSLTYLDISGHNFGDAGCSILASSLRQNQALTELCLDRNKITTQGWVAIKLGMAVNHTLQHMERCEHDIDWHSNSISAHERSALLTVISHLENTLSRNFDTHKTPSFRPDPGFPDLDAPEPGNVSAPSAAVGGPAPIPLRSSNGEAGEEEQADGDEEADSSSQFPVGTMRPARDEPDRDQLFAHTVSCTDVRKSRAATALPPRQTPPPPVARPRSPGANAPPPCPRN